MGGRRWEVEDVTEVRRSDGSHAFPIAIGGPKVNVWPDG
jgi:hypothetical protein